MNAPVRTAGVLQGATPRRETKVHAPPAPRTVAETGLDASFLTDLLVKTIYRMGLERPSEIAQAMKLPVPIIDKLIEEAQSLKLIHTLGQLGASMTAEMRYELTGKGREWALEALNQSEYHGAAPVPLRQFSEQLLNQSIRRETITRPMLDSVFAELTLSRELMEKMGPAANSGAAILLYGPPGNGKSSIAEAICAAFRDHVYFPHAVEVDRQVIAVYDPTVHEQMEWQDEQPGRLRRAEGHDRRYVACRRPAVITGGELTLDRLDLALNSVSRVYEAPMQLKAAGGVLVIDDFGRQRQSPQELINRLIIPLEKGVDYLSLETGRKFEVPFDSLVVFSTNIAPKELVDDAALRRLRYKVLVDSPDRDTYVRIFAAAAQRAGLHLDAEIMAFVLNELYAKEPGAAFQAFHPRFLIDQIRSIAAFEDAPPSLCRDFLRRAWSNLYTKE